jgi:hypothetical protein
VTSNLSPSSIGDLTKPATILIEKIASAVGGLFRPYQVIRIAKAEAEAELIKAESEIQVTDLHRRAMRRFVEEEATRQKNMEAITEQAFPLLSENSAPEKISDDWITHFFEKSRLVSEHEMQRLWARVLAGEANLAGAFSRRTISLLGDLDKSDAELFVQLCRFGWQSGNSLPLIFELQSKIYEAQGITFNSLSHLESLGLIQFDAIASLARMKLPKRLFMEYFEQRIELVLPLDADNELDIGHVMLTRAGTQLARVCNPTPVVGFFDHVTERWKGNGFLASDAKGS